MGVGINDDAASKVILQIDKKNFKYQIPNT